MTDSSASIQQQIANAFNDKTALTISAGDSKIFYGNKTNGELLNISQHTGIIEYQPSELIVTVHSGTLLSELEAELNANNQMLAFEPPQHSTNTTIGGIIACGLSGPRRIACGSARDFVLGTTIINGKAEKCRFGGQVMKNVAGYDASRLMVGAQGTLGALLDISLKVLPVNGSETTLQLQLSTDEAITKLQQWVLKGLPITANCILNNTLTIRLGSTSSAVKQSCSLINNEIVSKEIDNSFWLTIKNQTHDFFKDSNNLWRCSHQASTTIYGDDADKQLIEWNGALRWQKSDDDLYSLAESNNGHASRYPLNNSGHQKNIFQPLQPGLLKIHQRLKQAFDPDNILNAGRLYSEI